MSRSGLAGVTLGVLADQMGMSKSGLFAHFRSKEDVQIELLTHMAEFVVAHVIEPSMTPGNAFLVCGLWLAIGSDGHSSQGCREGVR